LVELDVFEGGKKMGIFENKWLVYGIAFLLIAVVPATALAASQPSGQPFQAIWNEFANQQTQINNEAAARAAADAALQQSINAEQAARIAADNALQNAINTETTIRINADIALQTAITNLEQRIDNEGTPLGAIIMWTGSIDSNGNPIIGSTADTNWHICDGTSGTPDLRNRFVVGAGASYNIGSTGGQNTVTLNANQLPNHKHYFTSSTSTDGYHNHGYYDYYIGWDREDVSDGSHDAADDHFYKAWRTTSSAGAHKHTVSGFTSEVGHNQAHENRPLYYGLAFIMKVA
jgi:microcystin-dependent protein